MRRLARELNETAAKLQQLLESQQAFVADASHELRTPLTALRLRLENIGCRTRRPGAGGGRPARPARRGAALARPGRRRRARDARRWTSTRCSPTGWPHWDGVTRAGEHGLRVRSTADRLGQIVDNLVANALAVSDTCDGLAPLRTTAGWSCTSWTTGPGLTAEERARAFDRFWRGRARGAGPGSVSRSCVGCPPPTAARPSCVRRRAAGSTRSSACGLGSRRSAPGTRRRSARRRSRGRYGSLDDRNRRSPTFQ